MLQRTLTQTVREAQAVIEGHAQAQRVPMVIWCGLEESAEDFSRRLSKLRKRWTGRVLAAVPYGYVLPVSLRIQAVPFSPKMFRLLHPSVPCRYRVAPGGRGSGKSHAIATAVILRMLERRHRVLCAREIQRSLRESVHHLLTAKIDELGLTSFFDITDREITCKATLSEIIFAGLATNVQQLKSLEGVTLTWVEEGESVSQRSLEILTPTIFRQSDSELWISVNPDSPDAPIQEFIEGRRPRTVVEHVIFSDNPWFPEALEGERAYLQSVDDDAYCHVWLGQCRRNSDAQVLRGKYVIDAFEPSVFGGWDGPYQGADWGFIDPTVLMRSWVCGRRLFVEYEAYQRNADLHHLAALFDTIPRAREYVTRADNARPETISYMKIVGGYPKMRGVDKWKGSVEDGVAFLRQFEQIVIHPRCEHAIEEARLWSYKVDKLSGDVLPDLKDGNEHTWDGVRYSLTPLIQRRGEWSFTSV
jgi:phage terminase large subunit